MEEEVLDELLMVLSNQTRRKILAKLVQERHYPLQLSKELRISQQAITKHLRVLEEHGVVESVSVKSGEGPPRKLYRTTRHFMVTISIDPKMFDTRGRVVDPQATMASCEEIDALEKDFKAILHTQNYKDRVRKLGRLLHSTEEEMRGLDDKRARLLHLRSLMLKEASSLIMELYDDYDHRSILYKLLDDPETDVDGLSRMLHMTEAEVRTVLNDLAQDAVVPRKRPDSVKGRGKVQVRRKKVS
jgi:ArsR family transcriptional regulator